MTGEPPARDQRAAEPQNVLMALGEPGERRQWAVEHAGHRYAVFAADGEWHVTDDKCPHRGGPLSEGTIRAATVTCPWHWYSFDLATGRCRTASGYALRRYPVVSRAGQLFAEVPASRPRRSWSEILREHARGG